MSAGKRVITALSIIALFALSLVTFTTNAIAAAPNLLTQKNLIDGTEIGDYHTDGGDALTTALTNYQALKSPVVRYGVYDCFSDATCGDTEASPSQSHTGALSKSTFETTISNIIKDLHPELLWIKLPPGGSGSINSVAQNQFCPTVSGSLGTSQTSDEWGMNLTMDKAVAAAIATVYTGPIAFEDTNEGQFSCYSKWGYTSGAASGVSENLGHMYAAVMPSLKTYAQGLGFSQVITVGNIGDNGGTGLGTTIAACGGGGQPACNSQTGTTYGYNATFSGSAGVQTRWMNEFNNAVNGDGAAAPDVESVHSYCHSADNSTSPGASNPYTFNDNICMAFQRQWIETFRSRMESIWGSTTGDGIRAAVSEWQAGTCSNTSTDCWSGFTNTPDTVGSYIDSFLSMLAGNGSTTGSTSTAYWEATLFEVASNSDSGAPGHYNIINESGTTPDWYSNVKSDFATTQAANPCTINVDSSTPAVVHSSPYQSSSVTTASFTPPSGSVLEVQVNTLQGSHLGSPATVSVSDSNSDTYTAGPSVSEGTDTPEGAFMFQTILPSSPGSITVTASQTAGYVGSIQLAVTVLTNAAQVQSGAGTGTLDYTGTSVTNLSSSVTTTETNSLVFVNDNNGDAPHTMSANTGTSDVDTWYDTSSGDVGGIARATSATGTPGSTSFGYTDTSPNRYVWTAQEVLPAAC